MPLADSAGVGDTVMFESAMPTAAPAAWTVIVADPVTGDAVAVTVLAPAAKSVAVSVVVLTPFVNETELVGYDGAFPAGLVFAPLHVTVCVPV